MSEDLDPLPAAGTVEWGVRLPNGEVSVDPFGDGEDGARFMRDVWAELGHEVAVVTRRVKAEVRTWRRFPDGRCPLCGGPVLYSEAFHSWACADPNCTLAQSDAGPGGGFPD